MPSLDMILNSSTSTGSAQASLTVSSVQQNGNANPLQITSTSFRDTLQEVAQESVSQAKKQLDKCELSFRAPKNPTMTYFGLQVQYEMTKDDMGVFFRHQLYGFDAKSIANQIWSCGGDANFDKQFPFVESSEVLEEIDANTKYVRRVVNLTISSDNGSGNGGNNTMKEEGLIVVHRMENDDGISSTLTAAAV